MTNSKQVILHIFWIIVSSHLCLWQTGSQWHQILWKVASSHLSYNQQEVSDTAHSVKSHVTSSITMSKGSEWQCTFCDKQSHHIQFIYDQQFVSDVTFCERQSHHIFSHGQQRVSDVAHFVKVSFFKWKQSEVSDVAYFVKGSHDFPWWAACEWHCTFCEKESHHMFSYDYQKVSDSQTLHTLWKEFHALSYDQQRVSGITNFMKDSLITCFRTTNRLWVTAHFVKHNHRVTCFPMINSLSVIHILIYIVWSSWPTGSEWHHTLCGKESHDIFIYIYHQKLVSDIAHLVKGSQVFYDQQLVNDIVYFVKGRFVTLFLWPTVCKWLQRLFMWHNFSDYVQ